MNSAKAKLKQAIADGDVDGQIEAQRTISQMTMEEARLKNIQKQTERVQAARTRHLRTCADGTRNAYSAGHTSSSTG